MAKMTEEKLGGIMQAEIASAVEYDRSDYLKDRVRAIEYYRGEMRDLPAEEGRSSAVTHDVKDTIGWILPSLMRVFFSTQNLGEYEPNGPEDEAFAKQCTDYVNYVVMRECSGYQVFWDVLHDALLHANGIVKHYWDPTQHSKTYTVSGIDDNQLAVLLSNDDVEVVQHSIMPGENGQPLHSLKVRHVCKYGQLCIEPIPPEEFLINRRARDIESARFVAHRTLKTRSELIEAGYDKAKVIAMPAQNSLEFDRVELTRLDHVGGLISPPAGDESMEEVEVIECYRKTDIDGDGVAEMVRAVVAGNGSTIVLDWDEWGGDVPFTDFVAERAPHRWLGTSIYDDTHDVQRIKTVLLRQTLDNLYQSNIPDRIVVEGAVKNPDALFDRRIGNVIRVDGSTDAVRSDTVPFTAAASIEMLTYLDQVLERRTGVSRATMALDLEVLQNQSATAVNAAQSAAYSKIELIARNLAEMGFRRFFKCILKLIVANQDRPRVVRLNNTWVSVDPRAWNADMDVTINVGLGAGTRDKDALALAQIAQKQEMIIAQGGPTNPVANIGQYSNTLRKLCETVGIRNVDEFFSAISPQQVQQMAQAAAQQPHQDPKAQEAQAKIEIQAQSAQAKMQLDRQKAAADIGTQRQKDLLDMQTQQQKNDAALQLMREKGAQEMQLQAQESAADLQHRREVALLDAELKREEMILEAQLQAQSNAMHAKQQSDNIRQQQVPIRGD